MPFQVDVLLNCTQGLTLLVSAFKQLDCFWELDLADVVLFGHLSQVVKVALGNRALLGDSIRGLASKRAHEVLMADAFVHVKIIAISITTFGGVLDHITATVEHAHYIAAVCRGDDSQLAL